MALNTFSQIRNVRGLSVNERQEIVTYLLAAIHTLTKVNGTTWFSMKDLMVGVNNNWTNKPLGALYDKNIRDGKNPSQAYKLAGRLPLFKHKLRLP